MTWRKTDVIVPIIFLPEANTNSVEQVLGDLHRHDWSINWKTADALAEMGECAHPGGMRSGLHCYATPSHLPECLLHSFRGRRYFLFPDDFAVLIQNAVARRTISQIQPDRELPFKIFFPSSSRC